MSFIDEKKGSHSCASSVVAADSVAEYEYGDKEFQDIDRSNAGSTMHAYFNVVCVIAGTGTLGLPYALSMGGWIGILILFLAWFMSTYTGNILVRCLYTAGNKRLLSYKDVATAAYGPLGGWITFFFNTWILLGAPVLYMVLCGSNFQFLCQGTAGAIGEIPWTIICSVLVAIPFIFIKSLKEVGLMAGFGAFATFATVLIVLIVACIDQKNLTDIQHDSVIWDQFPIALSTISFSFGGNVVLPHVEASMRRPRDFTKVLAAGLATCAGMYMMTAVSGYYVYGRDVVSPVYDSIPSGVPRIIAIVLMTVHVLFAAPILLTSFALDVEEMLKIKVERLGRIKEFCCRFCIRILIMGVVVVISCTVPHFDLLMSLIGSFANCGLIFIFPVLFYWRLTGFRNKPIYELAFCALIIVLGIVGLIFGTIDSIRGLINAY